MTVPAPETRSWNALLRGIEAAWPACRWRDLVVVVACSGGADSVALMRALHHQRTVDTVNAPRGLLVAAHYNHGLRAEQSDTDEAFVQQLAQDLQIPFESGRATATARDEATMRGQRSRFLTEVAHRRGARYVVTAHTADDNVETVLHHLMRGTGPAGIAGIGSPLEVGSDLVLVRPMLSIRRADIREGLVQIDQAWREDESNRDTRYRRNWIRHRLIPLIESEYPEAVAAVGRAIEGQRQWRTFVDAQAAQWLEEARISAKPVCLRRDTDADQAVILAALRRLWDESDWPRGEMTRDHWRRLATTLQADGSERYSLPGDIDVAASGDFVSIDRIVRDRSD